MYRVLRSGLPVRRADEVTGNGFVRSRPAEPFPSVNYVNGGTGSAGGKYDEYTYTMKEAFEGAKTEGDGPVPGRERQSLGLAGDGRGRRVQEIRSQYLELMQGGGRVIL